MIAIIWFGIELVVGKVTEQIAVLSDGIAFGQPPRRPSPFRRSLSAKGTPLSVNHLHPCAAGRGVVPSGVAHG